MQKNIALSFCSGYPWVVYERFVRSFLAAHPDPETHLVLFVLERHVLKRMYSMDARVSVQVVSGEEERAFGTTHCQNYRLALWAKYLSTQEDATTVFITDARDVLFQKDVFREQRAGQGGEEQGRAAEEQRGGAGEQRGQKAGEQREQREQGWAGEQAVHCFEEDATIDQCPINQYWLRGVGRDPATFAGRTILCSGTIMGSARPLQSLLEAMWDVIQKDAIDAREILDQAALNVVVYERGVRATMHTNESGIVLTLAQRILRGDGKDDPNDHPYNGSTFVTRSGVTAACVHQFDRLVVSKHTQCCWVPFRRACTLPLSDMRALPL